MIEYKTGDILTEKTDALVNTLIVLGLWARHCPSVQEDVS